MILFFVNFAILLFFILMNALCVAAEFSITRSRISKIEVQMDNENFIHKILYKAVNNINEYISAAQVCITISSLMVGAVAEPLFVTVLEPLFLDSFNLDKTLIHTICFTLAIILATFIHVIFGEFIPKTIAIQAPERTALFTILPLHFFYQITKPIVFCMNKITFLILSPFGINFSAKSNFGYSEDEIKFLIKQSQIEGTIEEKEGDLVNNVFDFGDTVVREIMIPRTEIKGLEDNLSVKEASAICIKEKISKMPVYLENLDNIKGFIYAPDLLKALHNEQDNKQIKDIIRPVLKIPENKLISDLLAIFKKNKTRLAIVIDEFGGTSGLVTLEDIIEELVGDIKDEGEIEEDIIRQISGKEWIINASVPIDEVNDFLGSNFSDEHFDTIGGFVFGLIGSQPKIGDYIEFENWGFSVIKLNRRIEEIKLIKLDPTELISELDESKIIL